MLKVSFRKIDVDGLKIFYREAGSKDAPAMLLLQVFRAPAICSATSSRNSRIGFTSSRPTFPGSVSPIRRIAARSRTHSTISRE